MKQFVVRSSDAAPNSRKYAKIRYHFVARNANELSVLQDEILEVVNRSYQSSFIQLVKCHI